MLYAYYSNIIYAIRIVKGKIQKSYSHAVPGLFQKQNQIYFMQIAIAWGNVEKYFKLLKMVEFGENIYGIRLP